MALSLGMKVGSKFRVGGSVVEVRAIGPGPHAVIRTGGQEFNITDTRSVEVLPQVRVSFGPEKSKSGFHNGPRLAFEAPREILIGRI